MDAPPESNPQNNTMPPLLLPTLNQGHDSGLSSNIADAAMPPSLSHPNSEPQSDPFSTRDLLEALAAPASAPLNGPAGTIQPRKGLPHKPKGPAHKPKGPTYKGQTPSGSRHPAAASRQELARHAACISATRTARAARTATAAPRRTAPAARTAAPLTPMDPVQVAYAAGLHFGYRSGLLAATTTAAGNHPMPMAPLPLPGPYLVALAGETPQALFRRQQEASARYQASCEAALRAALGHVPEVYPAVQGGLGNTTPVWPMDVPPHMELHRVPLGDARSGGDAHRRPRGSFPA
ncbi:hypothetical protein C8R46DRAFT_41086 [Mycena filopes]|nr:hypothetical protein C8R46DRAFT_41086 [Mycena filopes]